APTQVVRARHEQRLGFTQHRGYIRLGYCGGMPYRQVITLLDEVYETIAEVQLQANFRKLAQKGRETRCDRLASESHWRAHPHEPSGRANQIPRTREALLDTGERSARVIHQLLACLSERDGSGRAPDQ